MCSIDSTVGALVQRGQGDIGQACARMARAFGMKILALRRRVELSQQEQQEGLKARAKHRGPIVLTSRDWLPAWPPSGAVHDVGWICSNVAEYHGVHGMCCRSTHQTS